MLLLLSDQLVIYKQATLQGAHRPSTTRSEMVST
jgi:hypothetical protein